MDLTTLAAIGALITAIGTLVVAIATLINGFLLRSQLKLFEKQTILQRSNVYPLLEVESENFRKNKISLKLKNKEKGPAFSVGLCLGFIPLTKVGDRFEFPDIYEVENKKRIYPTRNIVFLKLQKKAPILYPNAGGSFDCEAVFCYSYFPKVFTLKMETPIWKEIYFDELKTMLLKNNVQFVGIEIGLGYKDITESISEYNLLHDVVADLKKHGSLEDVIKENIPFLQRTVCLEEMDSIPLDIYKKLKSRRAFLEEPFKG